ncbi:hypothetical protein ANO11243_054100 [Dothideomycetidae sp. 11243]|nr:hypothetical protein ANO11243_054100 [fungal sp. No.11243]
MNCGRCVDPRSAFSLSPPANQNALSNKSPRSAKIVSRNSAGAATAPTYNLKIGGSILQHVSLDEIFELVSPQHYEAFENAAFLQEIEERDRRELQASLLVEERAARRRMGKHRVSGDASDLNSGSNGANGDDVDDGDDNNDSSATSSLEEMIYDFSQAEATESGRHGRPRPTYGHFYLKRGRGRGRGRSRAGTGRSGGTSGDGLSRAGFKLRKEEKQRGENCKAAQPGNGATKQHSPISECTFQLFFSGKQQLITVIDSLQFGRAQTQGDQALYC